MRFSVSRCIQATPEAAWQLLASTAHWLDWGPSITGVEPLDTLVTDGLVGRVRMPLGLWLPFRIGAVQPPRRWTWSVLGIPATGHQVDAVPGGCRVTFSVPGPAVPYLPVCWWALRRMAALLESGRDSEP